jgi:acyl-CoA synthetase (AMP-forming)/AMP-acid ligase II
MNLAHLIHNVAARHPGAPAVTDTHHHWCHGEFAQRVACTATWLRALPGVLPGDRIGLALDNSAGYLQWQYGAWHAGLCVVPMNAKLHPREFAYILGHSGARVCLASAALYPGIAAEVGRDAPCKVLEADAALTERAAQAQPMRPQAVAIDSPAWLFYTSGTTGRPKGATLTPRNLLYMTLAYAADIDRLDERDTIVHAAPLSHGSGCWALPHLTAGSHNVVTGGGFRPGDMFEAIERWPRVSFFAAPTMLVRMMADGSAEKANLGNLRTISYGGAPMYVADLQRALRLFGPRLFQVYGQGESPMTITGLDQRAHARALQDDDLAALASAGAARTGVEVRIVDEEDRELPPGEVGEIVTRSDCVMRGYWENPQANIAALRGGWLHTGDVGAMDERGFLTLKDRSKDMIISGGTNIYPREIEDVLLTHPAVAQVSVVGAPHAEWGEEVVAFVVPAAGAAVSTEALDTLCLDHIARFKRPKRYRFVSDLPKNNYGKVLKTALREQLAREAAG